MASNVETTTANVVTSNTETTTANVVTSNTETTTANVVTSNTQTTTANVVTSNTQTTTARTSAANVVTSNTTETTRPYTLKISRYELYPKDEPTAYVVGFIVTCNNQSMYRDVQVPLEEAEACECELDITNTAFLKLKDSIEAWATTAAAKSPLIGREFQPFN
jgi:hypothetical protein